LGELLVSSSLFFSSFLSFLSFFSFF